MVLARNWKGSLKKRLQDESKMNCRQGKVPEHSGGATKPGKILSFSIGHGRSIEHTDSNGSGRSKSAGGDFALLNPCGQPTQ
jgi:hypothetical protein